MYNIYIYIQYIHYTSVAWPPHFMGCFRLEADLCLREKHIFILKILMKVPNVNYLEETPFQQKCALSGWIFEQSCNTRTKWSHKKTGLRKGLRLPPRTPAPCLQVSCFNYNIIYMYSHNYLALVTTMLISFLKLICSQCNENGSLNQKLLSNYIIIELYQSSIIKNCHP